MGSHELTHEEKLKRFIYTCNYHGAYVTGNLDKHICRFTTSLLFNWIKTCPQDFLKILLAVNEDPLVMNRMSLFYVTADALHSPDLSNEIKQEMKQTVMKLVKSDIDFFDFVKYYTLLGPKRKQKFSTLLRKMTVKFYKNKSSQELVECVTRQSSYHGWSHRDLIRLGHIMSDNVASDLVLKYVIFGIDKLPEVSDKESKGVIEHIKKSYELRTTQDVPRAVTLIKELNATVKQVNSKLNKNEEVWLAALPQLTAREILQRLYIFYRYGFFKAGGQFQTKIVEALSNPEKVKKCNLHPVEVYIHLKFFEKGGKIMDPKLIDYLHKKEIREETLKKFTTPNEPKCKPVIQSINKCLKLSYDNVQPTGKKFFITIDVTEKTDNTCFQNRRITFLEAAVAIVRYLTKVEKNVNVAVFKDNHINFIDLGKSHSAVDKLQEHKAAYIVPSAPLDFARMKKKQVDVFINFMSSNWLSNVPREVREKMDKLPEALNRYSRKMKSPDTKLVKFYLGDPRSAHSENSKNILSIAGFTAEVPRILEAFCRGLFC